jgi:hypothetical protein
MNEALAIVLAMALTVPGSEELARNPGVSAQVDGIGRIEECMAVGTADDAVPSMPDGVAVTVMASAPSLAGLARVGGPSLDPLLAPVDIWKEGEIGTLRQRVRVAGGTGDVAAVQAAADVYWEKLGAAMERRRVFEGAKAASRGRRR